ncbi:3-hydroxyacyl-CoA dehydrogenase family protein [Streptomyces sp. CB03238]|uniref:3-hydroxyacyl-CoA dehydrogenase family protein n=1 Tax=Streptomyces sp. CB03238 TaxID=1907777 RepID=UPI000A115CEC|nr:3-hydroxyacyl-CoA dehydrogenase family protein [Streptomyces sp. CB03238]ORT57060.1 3-hydroxybutyryl-CoA dehydrogenase [Streptomyces sp. CB03238]
MLTVAVVGAGLMGHGIAEVFAAAGHPVRLHDLDSGALHRAVDALGGTDGAVDGSTDLATAVTGADLVVEAVAEHLEVKRDLFARLDRLLPHALLATNTSVLPVSGIAERTARPERVVGTHWWNPPGLIPVVEVVRGSHTSERTMTRTTALLTSLGKLPVRVERDVPGFVGNRLQHALWREAIALVADGVCSAETVETVVRNTIGLRLGAMGPLENADYVGLDLTLAIHDAVLPALNRSPAPSPLLRDLVAAGDLGAKSGRGFLTWPDGSRDRAASRLARHVAQQLTSRADDTPSDNRPTKG